MESLADFLGVNLPDAPSEAQRASEPARAARLGIRERAKAILQSPEYFESVLQRIRLGTLPAAVELRFYDEAYGKPVERLEVKDVTDDVDAMTPAELEREAERLLAIARQLRMDEPDAQSSVH